jgi:hypothetical protein
MQTMDPHICFGLADPKHGSLHLLQVIGFQIM